jgi:cytochrome b561
MLGRAHSGAHAPRRFLAPIAIHLAAAPRHRFVRRDRVTSWVIDGAPI